MRRTGNGSAWRFAIGVVAVIGVAGCSSAPTSPSAAASAVPSATALAIASPTVIPSATPTPTPAPTPTPTPTPARPLTFVPTGSMQVARMDATATLLQDGTVLIAGGMDLTDFTNTFFASAEIYDPATGKFTDTGSMSAARAEATAVRLPDGRVLIAGGLGCSDPQNCTDVRERWESLKSADIYDPATGKFTRTGSMVDETSAPTAVLLPSGKVLIAAFKPESELYDPAIGQFVRAGKLAGIGGPITATLLRNGKVLVTAEGAAQLYDEASGKFTMTSVAAPPATPPATYGDGTTIERRGPQASTPLPDGRLLLFARGYLETYDPSTGACANAGFVSPGGEWNEPTATLLPDGRVLFAGGALVSEPPGRPISTNDALIYNPASGLVNTISMIAARWGQTATLLPHGSVLLTGGEDGNYKTLASAELFRP
jgi:Galactose oxidase, central domain